MRLDLHQHGLLRPADFKSAMASITSRIYLLAHSDLNRDSTNYEFAALTN